MNKLAEPPAVPTDQPTNDASKKPSSDNTLPIISMVLGVISLTGPGFLFGIPAIVTATVALKKNQGERSLSITGLVTGIISTVVSLLIVTIVIAAFIWGLNNPQHLRDAQPQTHPGQTEQAPGSQET